jgi:endonuclease/exonuclease/phosphatase family metal-dependent hydrolase
MALHLDSGIEARDHGHRRASLARLPEVLATTVREDRDVIVLGDLNTMGCAHCAQPLPAAAELAALDVELHAARLARVPSTLPCSEYSSARPALLDHIAVSTATRELPTGARAAVAGACELLACRRPPRAPELPALAHLSDHCPLVIELDDRDDD